MGQGPAGLVEKIVGGARGRVRLAWGMLRHDPPFLWGTALVHSDPLQMGASRTFQAGKMGMTAQAETIKWALVDGGSSRVMLGCPDAFGSIVA